MIKRRQDDTGTPKGRHNALTQQPVLPMPMQSLYIKNMSGGIAKGRVNKRGFQTFYVYYHYDGVQRNIWTDSHGNAFTNENAALDLLNAIRLEIKERRHDPEKYKPKNRNRYSFSNVISTYLESRQQDVNHERIGEAQRQHIERELESHLKPFVESERLRDIREFKAYHMEKLFNKNLPKWAPKTVKNFATNIHAFFSWCGRMGLIDRVPAMPNLPPPTDAPIRWLDEKTQGKIINAIDEMHQPIYQFMAWYGCRPREVMAIQRRDVNWDGRFILIQRAFKQATNNKLGTTKTRKIRPLPITGDTEPFIRKAYYGAIGEETFLFLNPLTGRHYSFSSLEQRWSTAWKRVIKTYEEAGKTPPERCTLSEGTRKTVASLAYNNGADSKLVAQMLGNSPQILEKHYAQLAAARFKSVMPRKLAAIKKVEEK